MMALLLDIGQPALGLLTCRRVRDCKRRRAKIGEEKKGRK